ncbi:MAG TPA: hypothetical protein VNH53_03900 [Sphingomicrobium sp.]|jgi:hypothetical protein|nr:hypothetical protein [Sphingomicrobium sp.]
MRAASFGEYESRLIGAPANWNSERDGPCGALSVHDRIDDRGHPEMVSRWELEPGDLDKLKAGAPIYLSILGEVHPVVCVFVGEPEPERAATDPALAGGAAE